MTESLKINDRHHTTNLGSSENTNEDKYLKIYTLAYYIQPAEKSKVERKS